MAGGVYMNTLIFHVDVNSAFLSWEASRRVSCGQPDLRLIPSCVSGDPSRRTSIVLAKSIPAKKFHVKTGESIGSALRKCPDLTIVEPDFTLYAKCSKAFKDICREYAPVVEEFSIDECFLDMTGTSLIYPDPIATAYEIKDKIREELGFTVNIGVGSNKLLAKMAGDFQKPDKVHTLFREEIPEKMWPLPVTKLLYCGEATAAKLYRNQIKTIGQLAESDQERVQQILGQKIGKQMHDFANGIDPSPVKEQAEEAKGYSIATTTEENVTCLEQADQILLALVDSVASHMRREGRRTLCISVSIRYTDFKNRSHQRTLDSATDITAEIYQITRELLRELWDGHTPLRLMGVGLSDVTREDYSQMTLFPEDARLKEKEQKVDQAVDSLRERFGRDIIQFGSTMNVSGRVGRKYKGKMEFEQKKI